MNGIPFYETDAKDRILKAMDDVDVAYKDFGMEPTGEYNKPGDDGYYMIRFETVNYIEIHRDKFVIYLGFDYEEYHTEDEFFEVFNKIIEILKDGDWPEFHYE